MKKIVKLTESDLTRIVKRVIEEQDIEAVNDKDTFFQRRLDRYDALIDWKMKELLKSYCHSRDFSRRELKKRFVNMIKIFIFEHIERQDFRNIDFNPYEQDFSEDTKKFEKIFNSRYLDKVKEYFDMNCTYKNKDVDSMKYFENIGDEIQDLVSDAVRREVNPNKIQNHSYYFKKVVDYVWGMLDDDENMPSKEDFVKFMKRDFADQIANHHFHLRR